MKAINAFWTILKMFFKKHKKIAANIGLVMLNHLRLPFVKQNIFQAEHVHFPFGFWLDPYVIGYTLSLASCFIKTEPETRNLSQQKSGEMLMIISQIICDKNWSQFCQEIDKYFMGIGENETAFKKGQYHAALYHSTLTGMIKTDLDEPILFEAKNLANQMHMLKVRTGTNDDDFSEWASAIYKLTYEDYVLKNYIKNHQPG